MMMSSGRLRTISCGRSVAMGEAIRPTGRGDDRGGIVINGLVGSCAVEAEYGGLEAEYGDLGSAAVLLAAPAEDSENGAKERK